MVYTNSQLIGSKPFVRKDVKKGESKWELSLNAVKNGGSIIQTPMVARYGKLFHLTKKPRGVFLKRSKQKLLGHSNPKMTQRYEHLSPDQLKDAIKLIDNKIDLQFTDIMYNTSFENSTVLAPSGILAGA